MPVDGAVLRVIDTGNQEQHGIFLQDTLQLAVLISGHGLAFNLTVEQARELAGHLWAMADQIEGAPTARMREVCGHG